MFEILREGKIYKNLVNGKWVKASTDKLIEIHSPIDKSLVGKVQAMSNADVDEVFNAAKEAQKLWRNIPSNERAEVLYRAAALIEKSADEIADIMIYEIAKDRKSSLSEINRTADFIRFTADAAKNMEGESIPGESFPGFNRSKISIVTREPIGVVLAISPFNYPINLSASKIAPAIAIGNSVVLKPPTQGSISALYLAQIFNEAGLPKGVLNTITGRGSEIGDYCVTHPTVNFINFTGSTEVGQHISQISSMKPLLMELGGKDAAIVLEDAELEETVKNIVSGAFSYSGQRCTAVKRILVLDSIADKLVEKLKESIEKLKVGDPRIGETDIVPLINDNSVEFVKSLIEEAKAKGAKLIIGGAIQGRLVYPTLFDNVTLDMRIAWEEPFGPVLPIIRVKSIDEAIEIANKSEYGLQASVFTKDINKAFYIADKLEVGTVQVNNKTERGPDHFPFLGVKSSGLGTQGIRYSIEAMSRPKAIVINIKK